MHFYIVDIWKDNAYVLYFVRLMDIHLKCFIYYFIFKTNLILKLQLIGCKTEISVFCTKFNTVKICIHNFNVMTEKKTSKCFDLLVN